MTLTTTDFAALEARVLAAAAPIRAALEAILAPVDAVWEQSVIDEYVRSAHVQMRLWTDYLSKPEPENYLARQSRRRYVALKKENEWSTEPTSHEGRQALLAAGRYYANVASATRDARDSYRQVRDAFLTRLGDKIGYVLQGKHADITGIIEFRKMIQGNITVVVRPSGDSFELRVKVMTNYRYDENSANRELTVYAQYPATFIDARVGGLKPNPLSEEMLGHLISGLALDHKERATRAQIDARKALNAEKHRVNDAREGYSRVAHEYDRLDDWTESKEKSLAGGRDGAQAIAELARIRERIAKLCATYRITDPGSKKAANELRKQHVAQLKALRAKKEG